MKTLLGAITEILTIKNEKKKKEIKYDYYLQ